MSTRDILFSIYKKGNHPELSKIYNYGIFPKGLKNYFEIAVVNEPSGFEPLKIYCIYMRCQFKFINYRHKTGYR